MYCSNCGKQLPEDTNFCSNCGKPQKAGTTAFAQSNESRWETCEIIIELISVNAFGRKYRITAQAIGTKGKYSAGESLEFKCGLFENPFEKTVKAVDGLISELTKDGWEPTDRGEGW